MQAFVFLLIGLAAGVLSGMFGIGGGVVIVPALLFLVRMPVQTATGTSLAALLLPVGALGAWAYYRTGHLDLPAATWIAGGLFVGAWVGATAAQHLTAPLLTRCFAVFLAGIAVRLWVSV